MFSQLLDFLDRNAFNYLARRYYGDKYVKQFTCYNQLAILMFGQFTREKYPDKIRRIKYWDEEIPFNLMQHLKIKKVLG